MASLTINGRRIGPGEPTYVVAELSGNHRQHFDDAVALLRAAREAGADAVKLQTYTPATVTLDCDRPDFLVPSDNPAWRGRRLWDLYEEAHTPWAWHAPLKAVADGLGLDLFSSPFDATAVEFLEGLGMPAYKVASFELVDLPLIERIARTGRPMIVSTGMATTDEIADALAAARGAGAREIALLKCTSAYPAPPDDMNLAMIPRLAERFGVPVGLSDHTLAPAVAIGAVALGACIVEKHLTLSRAAGGPDGAFSLEPAEFRGLVDAIRTVERSLGSGEPVVTESERANRVFRRSLYVVEDVPAGAPFTEKNVRSIRPAYGLAPRHLHEVLGRRAARAVERGTPLAWDLIEGGRP